MQTFFKFIFSGGTAAASKLVLFVIFIFFGMWYLLASALAFCCSIAVGFCLQKYVTFQNYSKKDAKKQAAVFTFVSLLNLLINIILMYGLVEIIKLNEILSQVIVIGIIACWNFFVYQKFVFKKKSANRVIGSTSRL